MQRTLPRLTLGGLETAFHTQFLKMKWPHMLGLILLTLRMLNWALAYMQPGEDQHLGFIKMQMVIGIGQGAIKHTRF